MIVLHEEQHPACAWLERLVRGLADFADRRFFVLGVVVAVALAAWAAPQLGQADQERLDTAVKWGAPIGIFLISGVTMPTNELGAATRRLSAHLAIQSYNLLLIPCVTAAVCTPLRLVHVLSPSAADGMIITAALPTTVNMCIALTRAAFGDEALAVFNAVLGNLIGTVVSPLLIFAMLGQMASIPGERLIRSLSCKVIAPLFVGQLARTSRSVREWARQHKKMLSRTSESLLLVTVFATFVATFSQGFELPPDQLAIIAALVIVLHFAALGGAWVVSGMIPSGLPTMAHRVAFLFASTQKTMALGLPLFQILFSGRDDLAILITPLLIQHPLQLIFGSFLTARLADEVKAEINAASASRAPGGENRRSQHRANGYYVATTYLPASYRASM